MYTCAAVHKRPQAVDIEVLQMGNVGEMRCVDDLLTKVKYAVYSCTAVHICSQAVSIERLGMGDEGVWSVHDVVSTAKYSVCSCGAARHLRVGTETINTRHLLSRDSFPLPS